MNDGALLGVSRREIGGSAVVRSAVWAGLALVAWGVAWAWWRWQAAQQRGCGGP